MEASKSCASSSQTSGRHPLLSSHQHAKDEAKHSTTTTPVATVSMAMAPPVPALRSSFLLSSSHLKLSASLRPSSSPAGTSNRQHACYPRIRAVDLDQNTLVAISVGVVSVAVGIGIPIFYESQIDSAAKRENTQPCFPCSGTGSQQCRFCTGSGNVTVVLGGGETEVSKCINCDGAGTFTCTTCQGTGIQPRYLDRREFKDDD